MKKQVLFIVLFSFLAGFSSAQSVPRGMNYQAVARDKAGLILAGQTITLKISLTGKEPASADNYYTEIQRVTTNESGVFTLVIGKGSTLSGDFSEIPWSSGDIWMNVSIKNDGDADFTVISNSKLMSVPYAFHAETASGISGNYNPYQLPGNAIGNGNSTQASTPPANSWNMTGNSLSKPPTDYIGTSDSASFVIRTFATERMRINGSGTSYVPGDINMSNSLFVGINGDAGNNLRVKGDAKIDRNAVFGNNLSVLKNVNLNVPVGFGGSTTVYGPFTVKNGRRTWLNGSLRVDKITNLNFGLNVNNIKPTLLTGTLKVMLATDLYGPFTVHVKNPSVLSGKLQVDSDATFKQHVFIDNASINSSPTDSSIGALVVAGGVGIGRDFNIAGKSRFGGEVVFKSQVLINAPDTAYNDASGALRVTGGYGLKGNMHVGREAHFGDSLTVANATELDNTLDVNGATRLKNKLRVGQATTLDSTLAVTGVTTLNNNLEVQGQVTISHLAANSGQSSYDAYPLRVEVAGHGVAVSINPPVSQSAPDQSNNFVSFISSGGTVKGRIEGQTAANMNADPLFQYAKNDYDNQVTYAEMNVAIATLNVALAGAQLVAASSASTACIGNGACVTAPPPSGIAGGIIGLALTVASEVLAVQRYIDAPNARDNWVTYQNSHAGVSYQSGSGDYAEYLLRADLKEKITYGDIVGVTGGKVTRNTAGADKIMVVSFKPIVLGNMPQPDKEKDFEKVAFMGQVPVKVLGTVRIGDYIIPSGSNDGLGIAVSPSKIKLEDVKKIAGVAWSASDNNYGINMINVAVGIFANNNNLLAKEFENKLAANENEINEFKKQVAENNKVLASLVPGLSSTGNSSMIKDEKSHSNSTVTENNEFSELSTQDGRVIRYYKIGKDVIEENFKRAEEIMKEKGNDTAKNPFWKRFNSDVAFKDKTIRDIQKIVADGQEKDKAIELGR